MLVRLKKRGELPIHSRGRIGVVAALVPYMGCVIEVTPSPRRSFFCGGQVYRLADPRFQDVINRGRSMQLHAAICEHALIDDLNAYDSDSADEQAGIGDLAFADVVLPVEVSR